LSLCSVFKVQPPLLSDFIILSSYQRNVNNFLKFFFQLRCYEYVSTTLYNNITLCI